MSVKVDLVLDDKRVMSVNGEHGSKMSSNGPHRATRIKFSRNQKPLN